MKKIKPVVLKDATKLTNREMKKIRGGHEPGVTYPPVCETACPDGTVAEFDCGSRYGNDAYCTSAANGYVHCHLSEDSYKEEQACPASIK